MKRFVSLAVLLALTSLPRPVHASVTPIAPGWTAQQIAGGLVTPMGEIAVDPVSHDAFVMDHPGGTNIVYRIPISGTRTVVASGPFDMNVIAFDPVTRELLLQLAGVLGRYSETGTPLGTLPAGGTALAIGPDGALYGAYGYQVRRFDTGTQSWQDWRALASPYLQYSPDGLAFAPGGSVFVRSGSMVFRADPGGTVPLGGTMVRMGMCATSTQLLVGPFALDPNGPPSTTNQGSLWLTGDGTTGMITGLATDPDGRIYLTALGSAPGQGTVWVLTPPGVVATRTSTWGALKVGYR
jgi:hypothetical protein